MTFDQREHEAARYTQSPFRLGVHMATHFVREILGIATLSGRTLVIGFVTALVGLPLVAEVAKLLVEELLGRTGSPAEETPLRTALVLGLGVAALWWATTASLRRDLRHAWPRPEAGRVAHADQRALVFSCSRHAPAAWTRSLVDLPPTKRDQTAGRPPYGARGARWLQLLIRSIRFHGSHLERLILVVDDAHIGPADREALAELVQTVLSDCPERTLGPLHQLSFLSLRDPHDAEETRVQLSGLLYELADVLDGTHRIGVQITGGTTATSVGLVLASCLHRVDVLYVRQDTDDSRPVRVDTDRARLRIQDLSVPGSPDLRL